MGQPTHFLPGRKHGMFVVPVPKEFTAQDKYTWTIVANGQSTSIPLRLHTDYVVSPFLEIAVKNTPPLIRFEQNAPPICVRSQPGRSSPVLLAVRAAAADLWAVDDMTRAARTRRRVTSPAPAQTWPNIAGPVRSPSIRRIPQGEIARGRRHAAFSGKATMNVSVARRATTCCTSPPTTTRRRRRWFQCCWSTAMVKVSVTP